MKKQNEKQPQKKPLAVALQYDMEKDQAPRIIAAGEGFIAEEIIEKAKEHGIKINQNATLAESLVQLEIGSEIPEELYHAVAEIFAFIARVDKQYKST